MLPQSSVKSSGYAPGFRPVQPFAQQRNSATASTETTSLSERDSSTVFDRSTSIPPTPLTMVASLPRPVQPSTCSVTACFRPIVAYGASYESIAAVAADFKALEGDYRAINLLFQHIGAQFSNSAAIARCPEHLHHVVHLLANIAHQLNKKNLSVAQNLFVKIVTSNRWQNPAGADRDSYIALDCAMKLYKSRHSSHFFAAAFPPTLLCDFENILPTDLEAFKTHRVHFEQFLSSLPQKDSYAIAFSLVVKALAILPVEKDYDTYQDLFYCLKNFSKKTRPREFYEHSIEAIKFMLSQNQDILFFTDDHRKSPGVLLLKFISNLALQPSRNVSLSAMGIIQELMTSLPDPTDMLGLEHVPEEIMDGLIAAAQAKLSLVQNGVPLARLPSNNHFTENRDYLLEYVGEEGPAKNRLTPEKVNQLNAIIAEIDTFSSITAA